MGLAPGNLDVVVHKWEEVLLAQEPGTGKQLVGGVGGGVEMLELLDMEAPATGPSSVLRKGGSS